MMKNRFRASVLAAVTATALSLSACSAGDSGKAQNSNGGASNQGAKSEGSGLQVNPAGDYNALERDQIQDGGELNLAISEFASQQNYFHANGNLYTKKVWDLYNPQVGLFSGDGVFSPNPDYLTEVTDEEVDGKTVVTYTINPKAQYNDGTPIDWTAFEHTWKFNNGKDPAFQVSSTDGYELIESVTQGKDERQAVVTFTQPHPWWQSLFNSLVPPQVTDAETFNNAYLNQLHPEWGAGPFKVEKVDFNAGSVSFVRNEKWWGEPAKLDKYSLRQMEDQASLNAFRAGELDATGVPTKDRLAVAREMGNQVEIRTSILPANYLITLNSDAPHLDDIKVREAIMTGIDRSQLAAIRFNGLDYTEELPGSLTLLQSQKGYEDNFSSVVSYDKDKAAKLLDEAGWTAGAGGIREKGGEKLSLRYVITGDSPLVQASASATQAMLKGIGVDLQIQERPSSDFSEITSQRDFDIFALGFRMGDPFGVAFFGQVYNSDSELNHSGTGTPELDAKIHELQKIGDPDEQIKRSNELEKEALATFGVMPYANGPDMAAVKPGLANFGAYSFAIVPVENIGWEK